MNNNRWERLLKMKGQGIAEYGLVLALVAAVVITGLSLIGPSVGNTVETVVDTVANDSPPAPPAITENSTPTPDDSATPEEDPAPSSPDSSAPAIAGAGSPTSGDSPDDGAPSDRDGDEVADTADNCIMVPNPNQLDSDEDGLGDACDLTPYETPEPDETTASAGTDSTADAGSDDDGTADDSTADADDDDDICMNQETCPQDEDPAPDQTSGGDSQGSGSTIIDPSTIDSDSDGTNNAEDNCPTTLNPGQSDIDQDGVGDVCDDNYNPSDYDYDAILNEDDNCPYHPNPNQTDDDNDGYGDACDAINCQMLFLADAETHNAVYWVGTNVRAYIVNYSPVDVYIQAVSVYYAWHPQDTGAPQYIDYLHLGDTILWDQDLTNMQGAPTYLDLNRSLGNLNGTTDDLRIRAGSNTQFLNLAYQEVANLGEWAEGLRDQFGFAITVTTDPNTRYDETMPGSNGCILNVGRSTS